MRKKMVTVLLAVVVASSIFGGCGKTKETSGKAESRETQKDSDNAGTGILGFLGGDEPEKLVRPEELELSGWEEWEYDNSGNQTKRVSYNPDGSRGPWKEYEYDKSGKRTKETVYWLGGDYNHWYEYEYDKSGNLIKKVEHFSDESSESVGMHNEYEYDNSGNQTKAVTYYSSGRVEWHEFEYDESGNIIKESVYEREVEPPKFEMGIERLE